MTQSALLFDLDGTLVDNVYHHVEAWSDALHSEGIELAHWRVHRKIGMPGDLMLRGLARELGHELDDATRERLEHKHGELYRERFASVRPLPGARNLLLALTALGIPWAIATSARPEEAFRTIALLELDRDPPTITREEIARPKPNPDAFLAAAAKIGVNVADAFVVGDSVWDVLAAQRAKALGIGVLSGGYGRQELETAGAYRIYDDPADLHRHLDELGVRQ